MEERTEGFSEECIYSTFDPSLKGHPARSPRIRIRIRIRELEFVTLLELESTTVYRILVFLSFLEYIPIAGRGHTTYENQSQNPPTRSSVDTSPTFYNLFFFDQPSLNSIVLIRCQRDKNSLLT